MDKEVFAAIRERVSHPIVGSYMFFLGLFNWKLWLLFFSGDLVISERIGSVSQYIGSKEFHLNFLYSAGCLVGYLYLLPFILEWLQSFRRKIILWRARNEDKFDSHLNEQKRLGGSAEVLATALRNDLKDVAPILGNTAGFLEKNVNRSDRKTSTDSDTIVKALRQREADLNETVAQLAPLLKNNYGKSTREHIADFVKVLNHK